MMHGHSSVVAVVIEQCTKSLRRFLGSVTSRGKGYSKVDTENYRTELRKGSFF